MSQNGLKIFDKTVQETNHCVNIMMDELETDNRRMAFSALVAGLHALRDRIGPENAVHLGAQLPMLLRGAYFEKWRLANTPTNERHYELFLDHVEAYLPRSSPFAPESVARAAFVVLANTIDPGEFNKVMQLLPVEIRTCGVEPVASTESLLPF